ncbi:MAG: hypothetical protein L0229_12410 [Blastocatellia bacterium]|nr:hypothetical protein [Blastocatellia bacterium]
MSNGSRSVHPNALPNYQNAVIPSDKLEKYALDPTSPVGKNKAIVFKSALGFDQSNWQLLSQTIIDELPYNEATLGRDDEFGQRYTVIMPITGPNGNTAEVITGWIFRRGADYPSLTTAYIRRR